MVKKSTFANINTNELIIRYWPHCRISKRVPEVVVFGMAAEKNYAYHLANSANGGNGYAKVRREFADIEKASERGQNEDVRC